MRRGDSSAVFRQLADVQEELRSERAMHRIETHMRDEQFNALRTQYLRQLVTQKRHFLMVWLLLTRRPDVDKLQLWSQMLCNSLPQLVDSADGVIDKKHIIERMKNAEADMLDELTFLVLPAYFQFFMNVKGIRSFQRVFMALDRPLRVVISRMVWFSPMFLDFLQRVLRPMISRRKVECLVARWRKHAKLCPSAAILLLQWCETQEEATNLLGTGCFSVLLGEPLWRFGLCDPHEEVPGPYADELRGCASGQLSVLVDVLKEIDGRPDDVVLGYDDAAACPDLIKRVLMSRLDDNVLSALDSGVRTCLVVGGLRLFHRLPKKRVKNEGRSFADETFRGQDATTYLRHLLQICDRVPPGGVRGSDLEQQLHEALVVRGPRRTLPQRLDLWRHLRGAFGHRGADPAALRAALQGIVLERTSVIMQVSSFARIQRRCADIWDMTTEAIGLVERAFIACEFMKVFSQIRIQRSLPGRLLRSLRGLDAPACFYARPEEIREEVNHAADMLPIVLPAAKAVDPSRVGEVLFALVTRGMSFAGFVQSCPLLAAQDAYVDGRMKERGAASWVDELLAREEFLKAQLAAVVAEGRLLRRMRRAFTEDSIFRKVKLASRVREELHDLVTRAAPERVLGADEWQPLDVAFLIAAQPSRLLMNYVFIQMAFGAQAPRFAEFFGTSVHLVVALALAIGQIAGSPPEQLMGSGEIAAFWSRDQSREDG